MKSSAFSHRRVAFALAMMSASLTFSSEPMEEPKLLDIIASPHSVVPLIEPMRIYPKAREYQLTVENKMLDGTTSTGKATAKEKWVDGQFIVSEAQPAGPETKFAMVVEYDRDSDSYRKYIVMGGQLTGYQVGTRVGKSRAVTWIDLSPAKFGPEADCLTTETHTDTSTTWISLFFIKGVLERTESGTALVSK
jgi:hypothetical protein